jgi:serine protease SohB
MLPALLDLGLFASKTFIVFLCVALILVVFFALLASAKNKEKSKGRLTIKNLNDKYDEVADVLLTATLQKKQLKAFLKDKKAVKKIQQKSATPIKNIYVLHFNGDLKASAVASLREEITAILNVATPADEIIVKLESAGGVVHGYGLAAAQLMRIRARKIPLTVTIDKIAASGGYMMACIANHILCAPFAIVGSIGVIVQLPNFHRVLQDKHVDFEQYMAGEYKRTITVFGENTDEGRKKLQQEIEDVHQLFKNLITEHRSQVNIQQVATGEHWLGQQALALKLVDEIKTSDEYLLERSKQARLFEVCYAIKKPLLAGMFTSAKAAVLNWVMRSERIIT